MAQYDENFMIYCEQDKYEQIEKVCKSHWISFMCIQQGVDIAIGKNDYKMLSVVIFKCINKDLSNELIKYVLDKQHLEHLKKLILNTNIENVAYLLYYFIDTKNYSMINFINDHFIGVDYAKISSIAINRFDTKYSLYTRWGEGPIKRNYKILKNVMILFKDLGADLPPNMRNCIDHILNTDKISNKLYLIICNCRYASSHTRAVSFTAIFRELIKPSINAYLLNDIGNIVVDYLF